MIVPDSESVLEVEMVLEALGQELPEEVRALIPGVELTSVAADRGRRVRRDLAARAFSRAATSTAARPPCRP